MKKSIILMTVFLTVFNVTFVAAAAKLGPRDIPGLITSTYIFAIIFVAVFILLATIIANLIKFEGGTNPKDPGKRRLWFWILAIVAPIAFFIYNYTVIIPSVKTGPALNKFFMHVPIGSAVVLIVYVASGFILAKMMSRSKIGNWFPSKK